MTGPESGFDIVLDLLSDGKYHSFDDIMNRQTMLNENQLEAILAFFEDHEFVRRLRKGWSTRTRKVMLTPAMLMFLERLKELEVCK